MAITQIQFEKEQRQLWTGGKDFRIKLWRLPEKWVSEEVDLFYKEEKYNIADEHEEKKEKKEGEEGEEDAVSEDDNDDVTGWCRFLD